MRLKFAAIATLIAALSVSSQAFGVPIYTIEQAVAVAEEHNPNILIARKKVQGARGGLIEARSGFLPSVTSNGLYDKRQQQSQSQLRQEDYNVTLEVQQNLYTGGQVTSQRAIARLNIQKQNYELQETASQVAMDVRIAFNELLLNRAKVRVRQDSGFVAERMWEHQAEDNVIERLQKIGLLAPPGEVDKVLQTVVNNLLVTNNIDLQSDVRCRVLLTSPLESFTIGHTIVISRGLLDVLPDEASLAMVLAHELGHIVLGHKLDTKLAFNDRMFFPDEDSFQRLDFRRRTADEEAADAKALELLKNSPYKDKLGSAGLFLKALQEHAPTLPNLIRPHLGNSLAEGKSIRMSALLASAPQLQPKRTDQIAALPLGGRIKLDPWTDQVEMAKAKPVALISARENMPFEITPFFPYLSRLTIPGSQKAALTTPAPK